MRKIYHYLREYLKAEFNLAFYVTLALFLTGSLYVNYAFGLEEVIIRSYIGQWYYLPLRFLFFATPFCFTIVLYALCYRKMEILRSPWLWLLTIFVLAVLTFRTSFTWDDRLIMQYLPQEMWYFSMKLSRNIYSMLFFAIPMLWQLLDRQMPNRPYGVTLSNFNYRPYLMMLLIMAPLLVWASYQPSFLKAYPRYMPGTFETFTDLPNWVTVGAYELSYGLHFGFLEYFFRGFLVMAFVRYLGPGAVLPMVSLYCWFHFGKPLGEAIGSIFGGYILGVIALRTNSILGGILIHIGVAFGMEIAVWLQKM